MMLGGENKKGKMYKGAVKESEECTRDAKVEVEPTVVVTVVGVAGRN